VLRELLAGLVSGERDVQVFGLDHPQASIAAGVDRVEWGKIHLDVERDAVVRAAVADAQAEGGNLGVADIDARCSVAAFGGDAVTGQQIDDRLLNGADQFAHLDLQARQVEQHVDHYLARAVVGHLATAVDLDQRYTDVAQDVLRLAGLAEGVDRRVLDDPQLVRRFGCAGGREVLHGLEGRLVIDPAQAFDNEVHGYRTTFTRGCDVKSMYSASSCGLEVATTVQVRLR